MPRTPQPLHILRKDIIHLWPEITAVLVLFAAFAACNPSLWEGSPYAGIVQLVNLLLHVIMPVSWLVLVSRVIHDEPLVGDRQFWTSRPYHWGTLLAAKVLFLLIFIYLPFFIMQCVLLKHAGLHPLTALPALGQNLLLLTVAFILPFTAIASVTGTFTRLLLSIIGAVLYMLVAFGAIVYLVFEQMRPDSLNTTLLILLALLPLAALIHQYATRNTRISVGILLVTPLLLVLTAGLVPFGAMARQSYGKPVASDPTLSDTPAQLHNPPPEPGRLVEFRGEDHLQIPFAIAKVDKDSAYVIKGVQATITAPGVHWNSPFTKPLEEQQITAGAPFAVAMLPIPQAIFNKVKELPADVHLTLATDHLKLEPAATWKASATSFDIPDHGVCSFPADGEPGDPTCRYAVKAPELVFVTAKLAPGSCSVAGGASVPAQARLGGSAALPNFLDPVASSPLTMATGDPDKSHHYVLCPDTPLSFLTAKSAGKVAFEVDVKQLTLNSYAMRLQPRAQRTPTAPNPDQQ